MTRYFVSLSMTGKNKPPQGEVGGAKSNSVKKWAKQVELLLLFGEEWGRKQKGATRRSLLYYRELE
ncbi:hypothetical protein D0T66_03885 [Dysgonomonas sp. 25]|nr:hypothetical protein [Dysgonomonas sp. 25]